MINKSIGWLIFERLKKVKPSVPSQKSIPMAFKKNQSNI
jgi:hypothetical protein